MIDLVLILQLATTLPLVGLIAFVQVAHYPLFAEIDAACFGRYHERYIARVTTVVAPLMLVELVAAAAWVVLARGSESFSLSLAGFGLVVVIWGSTHFLQVPCHRRLAVSGPDRDTLRRLVTTNAIRTAAWTGRAAILLIALALAR